MVKPSKELVAKVREWAFSSLPHVSNVVRNSAVLAFGSLIRNSHSPFACQKVSVHSFLCFHICNMILFQGGETLINRLTQLATVTDQQQLSELIAIIDAIGNAGPKCVDIRR
jgi:hypothetical protein